jgi:hypothetical protein
VINVWGVDLGVRVVHLAKISGEDGSLSVQSFRSDKDVRWREILKLQMGLQGLFVRQDVVFIEEPPMVRSLRVHGEMHQLVGLVIAEALLAHSFLVNVKTWKKELIGNGNAPKPFVAQWLKDHHPGYSAICAEDQDLIDATCVALHGREVLLRR